MMLREDAVTVGVDVGGTNLRVGIAVGRRVTWERRMRADLARRCSALAPDAALETVVQALADAVQQAVEAYPEVVAVGLAVPGFVDPVTGRLASSPNIPGLRDVDLAAALAGRIALPVVVENDALAAAWGEYMLHPEGPLSLIYLGLGTGVGGGLILEGVPYRGRHGVAMEVGHLSVEPGGRLCGCGNQGCLERYASATGVAISYHEGTGSWLTAPEIAERARGGDGLAGRAYRRAGEVLGRGAAHILKVLDIPDLVVGGGLSSSWDLLEQPFLDRLEDDLIPVLRSRTRVRVSVSGDQAGMLGGALLAARAHLPD